MKRTLLIALVVSFISSSGFAQDDFEGPSLDNWQIGVSVNPPNPVAIAGGPTGAFLRYISTGGGGPESRMVVYNENNQWAYNYLNTVESIDFDVNVSGNDLNLRIALQTVGFDRMCTTTPVLVTAGSGWTPVSIRILPQDFTLFGAGFTAEDVLSNVYTIRILSESSGPAWQGERIAATLEIDNVTAMAPLSVEEFDRDEFQLSPNPGSSVVNVRVNNATEDAVIEVFDVLGKRILNKNMSSTTSQIDVSEWNNGIYLVRVTSDQGTDTKRFIKQ